MTYILDIQKALELPKTVTYFGKDGRYCAFGSCFKVMELLRPIGTGNIEGLTSEARDYWRSKDGEVEWIVDLNNSGYFEKATRLAIQKILQDGFAVPAESDLELAKELLAQPEVACK
jgi:hypothetical protein